VGFTFDNWDFIEAPAGLQSVLTSPLIAFVNLNNRTGALVGTPQPGNDVETLFYVSPNGGAPIEILQMTAATGSQVYLSGDGLSIAYMRLENNARSDGLYVIDLRLEVPIRGRVLPTTSLVQRGIASTPQWSPDGSQLLMAVATGYDIDLFLIGVDGSAPINITQTGSYDFHPTWSPDGRHIAFLSDRFQCPSWIPGEPGSCDGTGTPPPTSGYVYVMNVETRDVRQISNAAVSEPPRWVNPRQISYAIGNPAFGDLERQLWIADIDSGQTRQVVLNSNDDPIKLSESWSSNGQQVIYQAAGSSTAIVLTHADGREIARSSELNFARYGLSAAWSPNGQAVAIGGVNGQCPYGSTVIDNTFDFLARANPPPSMCEPRFSPSGDRIAFTGVNPRIDGRLDIYVANNNGFGAVNLTSAFRGQIRLLGWVGG
jgi:Tol biopolymer transport system component